MPRFHSLEPRLHVADYQRSVIFYRDVLGVEVTTEFPASEPSFANARAG
jgi:catechol 2,3-dioxygenase-like lactoylglutathione lyase family enzyme